jgi:hypothetical protein
MKDFVIILLSIVLIFGFFSGCTSSTISNRTDPIIGTWKQANGDYNFIFFENGKAIWSTTGGTWEKYDNTHYAYIWSDGSKSICIYDSQLDTLNCKTTGGVYKRVK